MKQYATLEDTVYFWFASNDVSGSGGDGASPAADVRLAGAAVDAIPVLSPTPTLLTHANYPAGCYEVAIEATAGNGFAADNTYAVFCTLAIDDQNPTGFIGSFDLKPIEAHVVTKANIDFGALEKASLDAATPDVTVSDKTDFSLSAAGNTAVIDEFETQSQNDPTGFHVNVKEVSGTTQTANDNSADIIDIKAKTGNLPSGIAKNVALPYFNFLMVLSSNHVSPALLKTVTGEIKKDDGAFIAITNAITEVSSGMYEIASGFTQAEMNADVITLKFIALNCDQRILVIHTV